MLAIHHTMAVLPQGEARLISAVPATACEAPLDEAKEFPFARPRNADSLR